MLKARTYAVFVVLLVFSVFTPAIFGELITVDDLDMYNWLSSSEFTFKEFFFPKQVGGYYRPLIGVSYMFDKYVWFLDTRLMHLDNIIFHIFNSLLVYIIAYLILPPDERPQNLAPVVAALLFGVHPLTSESVNWISGRTDVMACTSVLLCALCLILFRERKDSKYLLLSFFALLPGIFVKETALAFIIGGAFLLTAVDPDCSDDDYLHDAKRCVFFACVAATALLVTYNIWVVMALGGGYLLLGIFTDRSRGRRPRYALLLAAAIASAAAVVAFFVVRKIVFASSIGSVPRTLKLIAEDLNYALQTFIGAAGFYVKKFYLPLPLNFAIREIDPVYNLFGVVLFFFCLYLIRRGSVLSTLFLAGVCMLLPALPLSLGTVTWTAYAERYIYISTAFWSLASVLVAVQFVKKMRITAPAAVISFIIIASLAAVSFQRSITWKSNLALFSDTVSKSPAFKTIRVDYMLALMAAGDLEGAKEQYRIASSIPSVGYLEALDINYASILAAEGRYDQAGETYEKVIRKTRGKSAKSYECYASFLHARFMDALLRSDVNVATAIGKRIIKCNEELFAIKKDPHILYRTGQFALSLGDRASAEEWFRRAAKAFPPESEYSVYASRLSARLEAKRNRQDKS